MKSELPGQLLLDKKKKKQFRSNHKKMKEKRCDPLISTPINQVTPKMPGAKAIAGGVDTLKIWCRLVSVELDEANDLLKPYLEEIFELKTIGVVFEYTGKGNHNFKRLYSSHGKGYTLGVGARSEKTRESTGDIVLELDGLACLLNRDSEGIIAPKIMKTVRSIFSEIVPGEIRRLIVGRVDVAIDVAIDRPLGFLSLDQVSSRSRLKNYLLDKMHEIGPIMSYEERRPGQAQSWTGFVAGAPKSAMKMRFYNKTQQLLDVHKDRIQEYESRYAPDWFQASQVWRIEWELTGRFLSDYECREFEDLPELLPKICRKLAVGTRILSDITQLKKATDNRQEHSIWAAVKAWIGAGEKAKRRTRKRAGYETIVETVVNMRPKLKQMQERFDALYAVCISSVQVQDYLNDPNTLRTPEELEKLPLDQAEITRLITRDKAYYGIGFGPAQDFEPWEEKTEIDAYNELESETSKYNREKQWEREQEEEEEI